jgi:hypothetical protein
MNSARWRRPSAGECYADLLLELHAYFASRCWRWSLHDDMMRAPGDGAARKN